MSDDKFEPHLGKMRAKVAKKGRKYLSRILAATALAGGLKRSGKSAYSGSRIGRGGSIARVASSRDRLAGHRARRAIIKSRIVKLAGKGVANARAHLRYIQRDGVTRESLPGELYSAEQDIASGKEFLERGREDRHQFRFIVSAEDGDQYQDLKPLTRRLMAQMETDLGTKLDWVAVDHFNTGHPHTHIMLRGKDDRQKDLVIAREYISSGMRERLAQLVELDLGPRSTLEIEKRLRHDIEAERLTPIDRRLLRDCDPMRLVSVADDDPFQQALRAGRLQKLGSLGLASNIGGTSWRLDTDLEPTLRHMGERGDIIASMNHALRTKGISRAASTQVIFDPSGKGKPLVGRMLARGLSDELNDRHFVLVDGVDGRTHYVDIGRSDAVGPIVGNAIVRIEPRPTGVRVVDRTIATIAALNGGRYNVDLHLAHDPTATDAFVRAHERRLEAMRKIMGSVEREVSGNWIIAPDHLERAAAYESRLKRDWPVTVEILSVVPLKQLAREDGATWLDRDLVASKPIEMRDGGFGREVQQARIARRKWLLVQGLADERAGHVRYPPDMIVQLERRALVRVAGPLSAELGLNFVEYKNGERVEGVLIRAVETDSGKFALIERARDFTLLPWRPVLERQIGKQVSGVMRSNGISWTIGRGRSGPTIS